MKTLTYAWTALALAACAPDGPPPSGNDGFTCDGDVCTVTGPLLRDTTFTADKRWLLKGGVFVGDDTDPATAPATLTIQPGTTIFGDTSTLSFLLITRGSKIIADGTADAPIVFTSAKDPGRRNRGDWGGLVVNGQAPVNGCTGEPCVLLGEAGTGTYGGNRPNDDSGVLRFVRVEFSGALIDDENELNAFAFQGVGAGTIIESIHAHMTADDCVEFFGGTANAKRVLCTGAGDDNLDWTFGWTGKLQFLVAQQYPDAGNHGIEADNNESNHELTPVSRPVISNVTLIGASGAAAGGAGVLLRRGTQAELHHKVVQGFAQRCFDINDPATFSGAVSNAALTGNTTVTRSIFDCTSLTDDAQGDAFVLSEFLLQMNEGNVQGDPGLVDPTSLAAPDYRAAAGGLAASGGRVPTDPFFEDVSFRGGCGTDPNGDWTSWTETAAN
jgi:hypothetical protein